MNWKNFAYDIAVVAIGVALAGLVGTVINKLVSTVTGK